MKPLNLLTHLKSCWTEVDWFNKEESRASDVPLAWLDSQNTRHYYAMQGYKSRVSRYEKESENSALI